MTVTIDVSRRYFRLGILGGLVALGVSLGLQAALLLELSVFKTSVGQWLLGAQFVSYAIIMLIVTVLGSFLCATVQRRSGRMIQWVLYFTIIGLVAWAVFGDGINFGLSSDVKYSTLLTKSGIDYLSLHYLNGATIWTLLILTALFMLSDPRVSFKLGDDGKRHTYMHSKLLGLLRLLRRSNLSGFLGRPRRRRWMEPIPPPTPRPDRIEWDMGPTPDHAVVSKDGKVKYNDLFRVSSPWFLGWTFLKFLFGILAARTLADNTALRFVTIQNFLVQTNSTWRNYRSILRFLG
jgi:hypothetical protein